MGAAVLFVGVGLFSQNRPQEHPGCRTERQTTISITYLLYLSVSGEHSPLSSRPPRVGLLFVSIDALMKKNILRFVPHQRPAVSTWFHQHQYSAVHSVYIHAPSSNTRQPQEM